MGLLDATLQLLREKIDHGFTQKEIADTSGVPQPTISTLLNDKSSINFKNAGRIIDSLSHEDFVKLIKIVRPDAPIEIVDVHNLKTIDVYKIAGVRTLEDMKRRDPVFTLRIPLEFFPSDFGIIMPGHSMENEYPEGCAVGIRKIESDEFFAGEDYLCCLPFEGLVIRRVMVAQSHGSLEFKPTNPNKENYSSQTFVFEEAMPKIKGRVTWVAKRK